MSKKQLWMSVSYQVLKYISFQSKGILCLYTLLLLFIPYKPVFSQQSFDDMPPKAQVEYWEDMEYRLERQNKNAAQQIRGLQIDIESAQRDLRFEQNKKEPKTYEIQNYIRKIERGTAQISALQTNMISNQGKMQEARMRIQAIKAKVAAEMAEHKINDAIDADNEKGKSAGENKKTDNELILTYPLISLPIPESQLSPGKLKQWRTVQEHERKKQFLSWEIEQIKKEFYESKEDVAAIWDGGIPRWKAQAAIDARAASINRAENKIKNIRKSVLATAEKILRQEENEGKELEDQSKEEFRAWCDSTGKTLIVKFVSLKHNIVTFKTLDGKRISIPVDNLWEEEKVHVQILDKIEENVVGKL